VEEEGDRIAYCESTCGICMGRHSDQPICHLYVGSVGEAVRWATDQEYEVIETHCIAKGDPFCRFEVGGVKG
jgi:predicted hydrocarbon binding protein